MNWFYDWWKPTRNFKERSDIILFGFFKVFSVFYAYDRQDKTQEALHSEKEWGLDRVMAEEMQIGDRFGIYSAGRKHQ